MKDTSFLRIEALSYRLGERVLLDDVNYAVGEGNCVALLGANGAGKSTLLDVCYGLVKPNRGRIIWFGREMNATRADLALVLQKPMFLNRSVSANLDYALRLRGVSRRSCAARIDEVLERVGMPDKADVHARRLSGGEQKCLSIARSYLFKPRVMLLDEPTAQLDYAAGVRIEHLIKDMLAGGVKIILTSHNPAQVKRLCDEIIFLDHGRIVTCAASNQFFCHPSHPAVKNFIASQSLV